MLASTVLVRASGGVLGPESRLRIYIRLVVVPVLDDLVLPYCAQVVLDRDLEAGEGPIQSAD